MIEKVKDANTDKLAAAIVSVRSVEEAYRFLSDLCTISEITEMSKRLTAAEMLRDGNTYNEIAEKTHVLENVKVKGAKDVKANTVASLLEDSVKYFKEFQKAGKDVPIEEFAKKSKKLVKGKSAIGLAIILPLAASMQYINRWITKKVSGVDGAPIYEDFGKEQNDGR